MGGLCSRNLRFRADPPWYYEIAPEEVRRRRQRRRVLWGVVWVGFAFFLIYPGVFHFLGVQGSEDLVKDYVGGGVGATACAGANRVYVRGTVLEINRVAVCEDGVYPPFKTKQRWTKRDWFVPYKDILSMEPLAEKKGLVPAYNITLKDGLRFQLNSLDPLLYTGEGEIRRYERMPRVIGEEVSKPENLARASRNEDITIAKERFGAIAAR